VKLCNSVNCTEFGFELQKRDSVMIMVRVRVRVRVRGEGVGLRYTQRDGRFAIGKGKEQCDA